MDTDSKITLPLTATTARFGPRSYFFDDGLRQVRVQKGLTILKAAQGIEIDPSMLSLLERGQRGALPETIAKIERFYKIKAEIPV